jgi:hypothetical protein
VAKSNGYGTERQHDPRRQVGRGSIPPHPSNFSNQADFEGAQQGWSARNPNPDWIDLHAHGFNTRPLFRRGSMDGPTLRYPRRERTG